MHRYFKPVVFLACLLPLARLLWRGVHAGLGANPIEFITHSTGDWTLIFLLVTLSITPLRKLTRQYWLISFRRMLGLFAFFYGSLHLTTYVWLDKFFDVHEMLHDIAKRRFITAGHDRLRPDDPSGADVDEVVDPQAGQALADAAPADLFQRRRGSDPLYLAGKGRSEEAAGVCVRPGHAADVSDRGLGSWAEGDAEALGGCEASSHRSVVAVVRCLSAFAIMKHKGAAEFSRRAPRFLLTSNDLVNPSSLSELG